MHVFRPRTDLTRVLLALTPLIGAALIAISRTEDYRHHVYDVTVGSVLGMLIAYFSYKRYYPGLSSSCCSDPYPSRAETAAINGYGKLKDEEERISRAGVLAVHNDENDAEHLALQTPRAERGRLHSVGE